MYKRIYIYVALLVHWLRKTAAIPGKPLKSKVTQEETRERKKQYEKDRERKFIDSWKQDRP
jgi:hypothetical protein